MRFFYDSEDYEKYMAEARAGEGARGRHFFGHPETFPCIGIEEAVEVGRGEYYVYLLDFAYPAKVVAEGACIS